MASLELLSVSNAVSARPDRPGRYQVRGDWPAPFGATKAPVTTPAADAGGAATAPPPAGPGARLVAWARDWLGLPGNRRRGGTPVQPELRLGQVRVVRNDLRLTDVAVVRRAPPAVRELSVACRARVFGLWWAGRARAVGQAMRLW
jgi:hypothetical protein